MASADEPSNRRFLGVDGEPTELTQSPRLCTADLFTLRRAAKAGFFPIDLGALDAGGPLASVPFGPLAGVSFVKI